VKKYCFDTSGLSTPFEAMPEDIHHSMWGRVKAMIAAGQFAATAEIYDEMVHIGGDLGANLKANKKQILLEVGDSSWDFTAYTTIAAELQETHHDFISEYCGGTPRTVCLADISIIALAKSLTLPVVSMELPVRQASTKRKIPDVCRLEGVQHMTFNDFLRAESIRI
jgi:hypothetical protein